MDKTSKARRSVNMSKIRSKDTSPEIFIRKALHQRNLRFRVNYKAIAGTPDLYFTRNPTAVFINGCFWHRHPNCQDATTPKTNSEFWQKKFSDNIQRDVRTIATLKATGIRILIIWECTIKKMMKSQPFCDEMLEVIIQFIKSNDFDYLEI
ncbi:very short patch repair endonuclease [Acetobacterium wieringae]|uniref:Very short patch repair endonuclease n=1 Tax=Acetobacterium wieringae TaxID=52694 RepID=A0A1F2PMZ8_9FIRM|nr:very short patch repair endonuclease [Acetobacterium wieringae]OFV72066.1 very short patch repair protein [Acetobacterium wieringae]